MSTGQRAMKINPGERAVSTDVNRLQAFAAADTAELLRYLLNVGCGTDDLEAAGVMTEYTTTEAPLRAEIVNGLCVKPQAGVVDLLVDGGVVMMLNPDAAPDADDSSYKYVRDPGVANLGVLTVAANASGSTRIDVVECARVGAPGYAVLETDNRDIFDETTGLFSAATVTKVTAARLQYRVRQGVPGSGLPAHQTGWLPLAVASVPAGSTNNDAVAFWDVRPLLADRAFGLFNATNQQPVLGPAKISATTLAAVGGQAEAVINGRRLGGRLRASCPLADPGPGADFFDATLAASHEPGIAFTASRPWYIYLCTPFGLPRWARYKTSAPRVPRSPRGLLLVSMTPPNGDGAPSAPLSLPTWLGGSVQVGEAIAVAAGWNTSGGAQAPFVGDKDGGYIFQTTSLEGAPMEVAGNTPVFNWDGVSANTYDFIFTLVAGTHFPTHARAVLVEGRASGAFTDASAAIATMDLIVSVAGSDVAETPRGIVSTLNGKTASGVSAFNFRAATWVELPAVFGAAPGDSIQVTYRVQDITGGTWSAISFAGNKLRVLGYRL